MSNNPLSWLDESLADLRDRNLLRHRATRQTKQRADSVSFNDRQLINFSSNDYLGLASERLACAVEQQLTRTGWGAGASPIVTGRASKHAELEHELAGFEGTQDALLFPTGFAANCGSIPALSGEGDVIYSDAKNHASIIDGCRLSKAKTVIYPHCDVDTLRDLLRDGGSFRRRLIVTDTLFSMDGDIPPLPQISQLAAEFNAMLMVDEAHATGVFGETGTGIVEQQGVKDGVHIRVGTLSKALGSAGGFVAGSSSLIQWLANSARSYVFSTAAPEALAVAGLEALKCVRREPERRVKLLQLAEQFRERLQKLGYNTLNSSSQIVPILVGCPKKTMELSAQLKERGMLVPGIRPPTVPRDESLLRISLSYSHTLENIELLTKNLVELLPPGV